MDKAYIDLKALYRIHSLEAFFITRAKKNIKYQLVESNFNFNIDEAIGLRYDRVIQMLEYKSKLLYPEKLRLIGYYDTEKKELFEFLTNNFEITAYEIANLYKNRWQIEVFFKWIKQNLTIKHLWGHSENAVKTHIWIAIISYLLIAYIKKMLDSQYSIYEIIQVLGLSVFVKTSIKELITNVQDNQYDYEEPNLFTI